MICDYCQGKTRARRVKKQHSVNKRLYIVENVPAEVCQECGERYYHAKTLDTIDAFLRQKPKAIKTLKIAVVSL